MKAPCYSVSMVYPCVYASLKGTSWYDRLIAGEFDIRLDRYPERETLIDRRLPEDWRRSAAGEEYRSILLTLRTDIQKDTLSPWDFLQRFRTARSKLFPQSAILSDSDSYSSPVTAALLHPIIKPGPLLYIPSNSFSGSSEIATLINLKTPREIAILVSESPELDLPHPYALGREYPDLQLLPLDTTEEIDVLRATGRNIICSHSWLMFVLAENRIEALCLADTAEWFVRGVLGKLDPEVENVGWPRNSAYSEFLAAQVSIEGDRRVSISTSEVLKRVPASLVQPTLRPKDTLPAWLTSVQSSSAVNFSEDFRVKSGHSWRSAAPYTEDAVHLTLLRAPESAVIVAPRFYRHMVSPLQIETETLSYFTSFNYYFTKLLQYRYEESGRSCGAWENFMLDYIGMRSSNGGGYIETLPLYNKAFLGCTLEGELKAFHGPDFSAAWAHPKAVNDVRAVPVNPADNPQEALYTPGSDLRLVGSGRTCAVLCHDTVLEYKSGPVEIPPFGAVLVTEQTLSAGDSIRWMINFPAHEGTEWRWLCGGFNMLVQDGVNLMQDDSPDTLKFEGWSTSASRRTQETALDPRVRQPRSVIGKTTGGSIIQMVFSGRSRLSSGVTFREAAELAMDAAGADPLDFLVNLDGGASASLTAVVGTKRKVLSYPAPSDNNPVQVPRPVPAMLSITERD